MRKALILSMVAGLVLTASSPLFSAEKTEKKGFFSFIKKKEPKEQKAADKKEKETAARSLRNSGVLGDGSATIGAYPAQNPNRYIIKVPQAPKPPGRIRTDLLQKAEKKEVPR